MDKDCTTCKYGNNTGLNEPCVNCKASMYPDEPRYNVSLLLWEPKLTIEEKRNSIEAFCDCQPDCNGCPLRRKKYCFSNSATSKEIDENYKIIKSYKDDNENIPANDIVNRPAHYTDGKIEVIEFIEDKRLGFCLGNVVKYVARAGKKDPTKEVEDLKKAKWYLERRIKELEEAI